MLIALLLLSTQAAAADVVRIGSTDIRFTAPVGFTELTEDEIRTKFPSRNGPDSAVGNERRTTTIAYGVKQMSATDAMLEEQIERMSAASARVVPGFVLVEQGTKTINGRRWAYLEFRSTAIDMEIRNILMMRAYADQTIIINFNASEADFATWEPLLRDSISSLVQAE